MNAYARQQLFGSVPNGFPVDQRPSSSRQRLAEKQIFLNRQRGYEVALLMHDLNSSQPGLLGGDDVDQLPTDQDIACCRWIYARENLDERRFAGAILANERVNFSRTQR